LRIVGSVGDGISVGVDPNAAKLAADALTC
jgi:hypothetical protein